MSAVNRKNNPCQNPHCGNMLFIPDCVFEYKDEKLVLTTRIWKCTNCTWVQPRVVRYRPTNESRAHMLWSRLRNEWQAVNVALDALVAQGAPSGCILVHSSTYNYHMDKLLLGGKFSNQDIKYHTSEARKDLEKAKQFILEKGGTVR
jgi:hypothetical protein